MSAIAVAISIWCFVSIYIKVPFRVCAVDGDIGPTDGTPAGGPFSTIIL